MADERKTRSRKTPAGSSLKQAGDEPEPAPSRKPPRPSGCRRYARTRTAEAMPSLVDALIRKSEGGSLGHMKLLVQLGGLDQAAPVAVPKRSGGSASGPAKALVEELEAAIRKRDEAKAAAAAAGAAVAADPLMRGERV